MYGGYPPYRGGYRPYPPPMPYAGGYGYPRGYDRYCSLSIGISCTYFVTDTHQNAEGTGHHHDPHPEDILLLLTAWTSETGEGTVVTIPLEKCVATALVLVRENIVKPLCICFAIKI